MFDADWEAKRLKAAFDPKNPFCPFSNDEHYIWCALENIMFQFNTRGCMEPSSIVVEDFVQGIIAEGAFKGIPFVRLLENYAGQKNNALSLKKYQLDAENQKKKTFPVPYSEDPLSCYQTTIKLIEWCPDAATCEGPRRIFRKLASAQQQQDWVQQGLKWKLSPLKARVIGKNTINTILKKVAVMCGYSFASRCTAHGKRRAGLSACANAGVSSAVMMKMGGHSSLQMVATYQAPNQDSYDHAIKAKHGTPTKIRAQLNAKNKKVVEDDEPDWLLDVIEEEESRLDPGQLLYQQDSVMDYSSSPISFFDANQFQDTKPAAVDLPSPSTSPSTESFGTYGAAGVLGAMTQREIDVPADIEYQPPSTPFADVTNKAPRTIAKQVSRSFDCASVTRSAPTAQLKPSVQFYLNESLAQPHQEHQVVPQQAPPPQVAPDQVASQQQFLQAPPPQAPPPQQYQQAPPQHVAPQQQFQQAPPQQQYQQAPPLHVAPQQQYQPVVPSHITSMYPFQQQQQQYQQVAPPQITPMYQPFATPVAPMQYQYQQVAPPLTTSMFQQPPGTDTALAQQQVATPMPYQPVQYYPQNFPASATSFQYYQGYQAPQAPALPQVPSNGDVSRRISYGPPI